MKLIRYLYIILIFSILIYVTSLEFMAMEPGFLTDNLSEKEMNTVLSNVKISLLKEEPKNRAIRCFDVSENGSIALGFGDSVKRKIGVYSSNGDFEYGFEFNSYGTYGVEWDEDNLIIYLVRSDIAITVDSMGQVVDVLKIKDTHENNSYWHNSVFSTKRIIGKAQYILRNDMGILNVFIPSSYSQLVLEQNGTKTILYDVNVTQLPKVLLMVIGISGFVCFAIYKIVKNTRGW